MTSTSCPSDERGERNRWSAAGGRHDGRHAVLCFRRLEERWAASIVEGNSSAAVGIELQLDSCSCPEESNSSAAVGVALQLDSSAAVGVEPPSESNSSAAVGVALQLDSSAAVGVEPPSESNSSAAVGVALQLDEGGIFIGSWGGGHDHNVGFFPHGVLLLKGGRRWRSRS